MEVNSVKWYESRVIWAAIVSAICGLLNLVGKQVAPELQGTIVDWLTQGAGVAAALYAAYGRTTATTVIEGSKGEQKVIEQGGTVTPMPKTP